MAGPQFDRPEFRQKLGAQSSESVVPSDFAVTSWPDPAARVGTSHFGVETKVGAERTARAPKTRLGRPCLSTQRPITLGTEHGRPRLGMARCFVPRGISRLAVPAVGPFALKSRPRLARTGQASVGGSTPKSPRQAHVRHGQRHKTGVGGVILIWLLYCVLCEASSLVLRLWGVSRWVRHREVSG